MLHTMAKSKSPKPTQLPAPINPHGIKPVYVNNMQLQINGLEARLLFNEIIPDVAGAITIELRSSVVMPIWHFLAMVNVLGANVQNAVQAATATEASILAPAKDAKKV
jgi:hypothetical protein